MADLKTTASFDDSQVDVGLARMNRKFKAAGEGIEKSTEGARKFAGGLSSAVGAATGLVGVIGAVTGGVLALAKGVELVSEFQDRLNAKALQYAATIDASRSIVRDFALSGQRERGDIDEFGARRLAARQAAEEARNDVVEKFIALNAKAVDGITLESEAVERLAELRRKLAEVMADASDPRAFDDPGRLAALDRRRRALQEQIELLIAMRVQLRAVAAEEERRIEFINEEEAAARAAGEERQRQLAAEQDKLREIEKQRQEAEDRRRAIDVRRADDLERQLEIDRQRALGDEDRVDALEREERLRRTIRSIEEAEGLDPARRRELIDKAQETARIEEAAARARITAAQVDRLDAAAIDPRTEFGTIGLAAGVGAGNALLQSQVFGAGGTPAEQQQLQEQRRTREGIDRIFETIERFVNEPRLVA
jgi:hypothetical protein